MKNCGRPLLNRLVGVTAVVLPFVLASSGCSLFRFGAYDSFGGWYVGRESPFVVDSIGFTSLDGSLTGYVVNDLVLRTPVSVVYEAGRTALIPVAVPYYACTHVLADGEADTSPERPEEEKQLREQPPAQATSGGSEESSRGEAN